MTSAIKRVLAAFRSTEHHVDEDDIEKAWTELLDIEAVLSVSTAERAALTALIAAIDARTGGTFKGESVHLIFTSEAFDRLLEAVERGHRVTSGRRRAA